MALAKKVSDIPGYAVDKVEKKAKRARRAARLAALSGRTFEDLSNAEKDVLLKAVGVALGLIKDSDDA